MVLPSKSEVIYDILFDILLAYVTNHPKSIFIDFKKAVVNIIKRKLPTTTIRSCFSFFHFKQALWKKIQVCISYLTTIKASQLLMITFNLSA